VERTLDGWWNGNRWRANTRIMKHAAQKGALTIVVLLVIITAVPAQEVNGRSDIHDLSEKVVTWDANTFPGFYSDIDSNFSTEYLTFRLPKTNPDISTAVLSDQMDADGNRGIVYNSTAKPIDFNFHSWGKFELIGFLGEYCFAAYDSNPPGQSVPFLYSKSEDRNLMAKERISKILIDRDDELTFNSSSPLKLEEDYELAIKAVDVDGKKIHLELTKDGKAVDSKVISPSIENAAIGDNTYYFSKDLGDIKDKINIVIIAVHFKNVFSSAGNIVATIDEEFQISDEPIPIKLDQQFDKLSVKGVDPTTMTIVLDNKDNPITLRKNQDIKLMNNFYIHTADQDDSNPLRYYLYYIESYESPLVEDSENWSDNCQKDSSKIINATDVLNDSFYEGDELTYKNKIINGNFIINRSNLMWVRMNRTLYDINSYQLSKDGSSINSSILIENSTINGNVDFSNALFQGYISFYNTTINGNVTFFGSEFKGYANFMKSNFSGSAIFTGSQFDNYADFSDSQFNGIADFRDSKFKGEVYFGDLTNKYNGSRFIGDASFNDSQFNGFTNFSGSRFKKIAYFIDSLFNGYTEFWHTQFDDITDFKWATFDYDAMFSDSVFQGNTSFNSCQFKDAFFERAKLNILDLSGTKYGILKVRWNNISELVYDDAAYMSLIQNFKNLGYFEDADNCYYKFRVEQYKHFNSSFNSGSSLLDWVGQLQIGKFLAPIDLAAGIFYGYGKKPLNSLFWSIICIFLFGAIWTIVGLDEREDRTRRGILEKYGFSEEDPSKKSLDGRDWRRNLHNLFQAMAFSTTIFLSGTKLFIDPPDLPETQKWSRSMVKTIFTAERVLGAFFSILFFLALGATVVR
jgi:S-layer protein (TIGR01567 family)